MECLEFKSVHTKQITLFVITSLLELIAKPIITDITYTDDYARARVCVYVCACVCVCVCMCACACVRVHVCVCRSVSYVLFVVHNPFLGISYPAVEFLC